MDQKNSLLGGGGNRLHIKLSFVILIAIFLPLILTLLIRYNPIFAIIFGIVAAGLAIGGLFIFLRPLDSILKGTKILSSGNLSYRIDIRSQDELEQVANSFNFLAQTLKNAVENMETDKSVLSSEKNKLSLILSSIIDGIIAIDGQRNIVLINKSAEAMSGYTQSELEGKPINQLIHLFSDKTEVDPKTYCKTPFIQSLNLVGKAGKGVKINLFSSNIIEGVQTNLSCILILHDLTSEHELEQMKLDFVSMASHELKTPLTSMKGYLSVFISENKKNLSADAMELLYRAEASTQQLSSLIENLLSVNKIERGQMNVRVEPINYNATLEKAVEDLQTQAKQKNITLNLLIPVKLPSVMADPIRIVEVVNNLVSNAIHYTNPNGSITVYTQINSDEVVTVIEDTGIGIPPEAISELFNKFVRVSSNQQVAEKGTGLGLYISKSIIEKSGGKIWVESEVGKGSKFFFSLPKAPEDTLSKIDTQKFVGESIQHGGLNY